MATTYSNNGLTEHCSMCQNCARRLHPDFLTGYSLPSYYCDHCGRLADCAMVSHPAEMCFYEPGSLSIVDVARPDGRSSVYGETLEEVRRRYPKAELIPWHRASAAVDLLCITHYKIGIPEEVTEEQYTYALEVLPPCRWSHGSFYVSELQYRNIADWYICVGLEGPHRYFHMYNYTNADKYTMTDACRALCK